MVSSLFLVVVGPFVVSFLVWPNPTACLGLIMECLHDKRTELPICSSSGSLVPYIYGGEGISEELVPHGLCFVVPWLPSWSRARWAPGHLVQLSCPRGFSLLFLPL